MYQAWRYHALMSMGRQPRRHSALDDAVADEIRALRRAQEMSQAELAKRAGVSRVQMVRIENKERVLTVTQVEDFAKALGLPMIELFVRAESRVASNSTPADRSQVSGE